VDSADDYWIKRFKNKNGESGKDLDRGLL